MNKKNNYLDTLSSLISKGIKIYNEYDQYKKDPEKFKEKNEDFYNNFKMFDHAYSTVKETIKNNTQNKVPNSNNDYKNPREHYYTVLECTYESTDKEIKDKYKKLVKEYHPDTISGKDLPQGFIDFAHKRFKEIQEAYDYIKIERNMK